MNATHTAFLTVNHYRKEWREISTFVCLHHIGRKR